MIYNNPVLLCSLLAFGCVSPTTTSSVTTTPTTSTSTSTTSSLTTPTTSSKTGTTSTHSTVTSTTTVTTTKTKGPEHVVRFVALGDAGEGNDAQYAVADAIKSVCDDLGCDFAIYLGDDFYDSGVDDVDDPLWDSHFESPYINLNFPFYPVLGNHDYGGEGIGWELWKGGIYVDYSDYSDKWTMPDLYYSVEAEHVEMFALDTTQIFWSFGDAQSNWLQDYTGISDAEWKIAFGHHPYISNGAHGVAGNYEGLGDLSWVPGLDIAAGVYMEEFFEEALCGNVDLYVCGHDHTTQWLEPMCGTEFIVSGAGAKTTDLGNWGVPTFYENDTEPGFVWIEIADNVMTANFYNSKATLLYSSSVTK